MKWMSAVLLVFYSTLSLAAVVSKEIPYYPKDFYEQLNHGLQGDDLKKQLFQVLSQPHAEHDGAHDTLGCGGGNRCVQHTSVGYKNARKIIFGEIHLETTPEGYGIFDVYCQVMMTEKDFKGGAPGPGKIPNNNIMNVEHTWPQSRFNGRFKDDLQKSDLHHLFPTASHANSVRGSFPFSDVSSVKQTPCAGAILGRGQTGQGTYFFEPPTAQKGNTARAIFYFSTRYQIAVTAEEEASLKAWHRLDPVDEAESRRNEVIFSKQKVRNPFIDHPELVELISDY